MMPAADTQNLSIRDAEERAWYPTYHNDVKLSRQSYWPDSEFINIIKASVEFI